MLIARVVVLAATFLVSHLSLAASFDCKKAGTTTERLICADSQLSAIDESLNLAYKTVLSSMQDKSFIVRWQREWLKSSAVTNCKTVECLRPEFSARNDLINRVAIEGITVPWSGNYVRYYKGTTDRDSATLFLLGLKNNQIYVSGSAFWYGPNANIGQINIGEIEGNGFVRGNRASFDLDGCTAEMVLKQSTIVVESETGCGGLNVSFVGDYKRK
jgi:uncharacterized protein YecT (DUF1311 family)